MTELHVTTMDNSLHMSYQTTILLGQLCQPCHNPATQPPNSTQEIPNTLKANTNVWVNIGLKSTQVEPKMYNRAN